MPNKDLLFLKKAVTRVALNKGAINANEYENLLKNINALEEKINYENKLRQYKINETKRKIARSDLMPV